MKTLKKSLCLILSVIMVVGVLAVSASAATFTDDEKIQYKEAVEVLSAIKVIDGIGDGSFAPTATLTREQGAAIVIRAVETRAVADLLSTSAASFTDVPATWWSAGVVSEAAALGIVNGIGDGSFAPTAELTGAQFAKMLLVAVGIEGEFTGANWQNNVIRAAAKAGIVDGLTTAVYNRGITREEAAQMAWNALQYSANGKTTVYTITVEGVANPIYTGTNEDTARLIAGLRANAVLKESETAEGSISDLVYGLSRDTSTDVFGRPTVVVTDGKTNGVEVVVAGGTPILTYTTAVSGSKIFKDLGLAKTATATKVYVNGALQTTTTTVADGTSSTTYDSVSIAANNTDAIANTGNGVTTEVYKSGSDYTIVIVAPRFTTVRTVRTATVAATGKKETTVTFENNTSTTKFTNFEKGDAVIYTYTMKDGQEVVQSVELAGTVSGTLTKATNATGNSGEYTIAGGVYGISAIGNLTATSILGDGNINMNKTVNYYLDSEGYLVAAVGATNVAKNYIQVLASADPSKATENYLDWTHSQQYVGKVYGVLSDGSYGEYVVNYSQSNMSTSTGLTINAVYSYTVNQYGELVVETATDTLSVSGVKTGATYVKGSDNVYRYFNSATTYIYFTQNTEDRTVKTFSVQTGNTNSGYIANGTAVYEGNVVVAVFVGADYTEGATTADVAYVKANTQTSTININSNGGIDTIYSYKAITSADEEITLTSTTAITSDGIYEYDTDGKIGNAASNVTSGRISLFASTVVVETPGQSSDKAYNYDPSNVAIVGQDLVFEDGAYIVAVVKDVVNITNMWVIPAPTTSGN